MSATQGASRTIIERLPPSLKSLVGVATSTIHLTGVAFKGPVGQVTGPYGAWSGFKKVYGGLITTSYLPVTVWGIMRAPRGLKRVYITRVTHFTDPDDRTTTTAVAGTLNLAGNTTNPTQGAVTSGNAGTFNLESGQTLDIHCDEDVGGPDTATFTGTVALLPGAPWVGPMLPADQLTFFTDADPDPQVVVFAGGETLQQTADLINGTVSGITATVVGPVIDLTSNTEGTDGRVQISAEAPPGVAAKIGHVVGPAAVGGGNVANIDAVTFAEAKSIIEAAVVNPVSGVLVTEELTGEITITSQRVGGGVGSSVQIEVGSTAVGFNFDNLLHQGTAASVATVVVIDAKYPGDHTLTIDVEDPTDGDATHYKIKVYQAGELVETWDDLPADSGADTIVNDADVGSTWITLTDQGVGFRPTNVTAQAVAGGSTGLVGLVDADFIGDAGIRSTRLWPDYIALRAVPGWATAVVQPDLVNWCEETNSFAVLGGAFGFTVDGVRTYVKTTAGLKGLSEYGAFYWPNVKIANPDTDVYGDDTEILVNAEGAVLASIIVQDSKPGGVHEAAGGLENGRLWGVTDVETEAVYDEVERDKLYPDRINIIHHDATGEPFYIDGSRTLASGGPFPSIGESRGVIYITETVRQFVDPKRHQNITLRLLAEVRNAIELFLRKEAKLGAFFTADPAQAFYVDTSENVNPPSERAKHVLHVVLGLNKAEPAEWIVLEVTKDTRALFEELGL